MHPINLSNYVVSHGVASFVCTTNMRWELYLNANWFALMLVPLLGLELTIILNTPRLLYYEISCECSAGMAMQSASSTHEGTDGASGNSPDHRDMGEFSFVDYLITNRPPQKFWS